jgi:methylated-DNA-[protein]-cysteine S-methyltransferase
VSGGVKFLQVESPLGELLLCSQEQGLCGLFLPTHLRGPQPQPEWELAPEDRWLALAASQLEEYFLGDRQEFTIPLVMMGTPFQVKVWDVLRKIPFGETRTYGELAREVSPSTGGKGLARAVGGANARNPVSIIVPCHRIIGSAGELTGYAGGKEAKAWLLRHESAQGSLSL